MSLYDTRDANWEDAYATVLQEHHFERSSVLLLVPNTRTSHEDRLSRRRLLVGLTQASAGPDEEHLE